MAIEATIVTPVTEEVVKGLVPWIGRQMGYVIHSKRNIDNLKKEMEKLAWQKEDLQNFVKIANNKGAAILKTVEGWLKIVGDLETEVNTLTTSSEANEGCFKRGIIDSYRFGKKAKKKMQIIGGLKTEGHQFNNNVAHELPPPTSEDVFIADFIALVSTVMKGLKDETYPIFILCSVCFLFLLVLLFGFFTTLLVSLSCILLAYSGDQRADSQSCRLQSPLQLNHATSAKALEA